MNHARCVGHHGNEKVDQDDDNSDLVDRPHEHGDCVGEFVGDRDLISFTPSYAHWLVVIISWIQESPEQCVEQCEASVNLICISVFSCFPDDLEWLEHCPHEDAKGAEHDEVDNDSFQHILQHIDDAHDKGSKRREEEKDWVEEEKCK